MRRAKGWTQESGITVRTIQRLEAGNDASLESISLVAKALDVHVGELFQSVQTSHFSQAVEGLESRTRAEQERRNSITHGIMMIFNALGIVVTFGTVILGTAGGLGGYIWLLIPLYWGAGKVLLGAIVRLVVDPKLNAKFPLSSPAQSGDS